MHSAPLPVELLEWTLSQLNQQCRIISASIFLPSVDNSAPVAVAVTRASNGEYTVVVISDLIQELKKRAPRPVRKRIYGGGIKLPIFIESKYEYEGEKLTQIRLYEISKAGFLASSYAMEPYEVMDTKEAANARLKLNN